MAPHKPEVLFTVILVGQVIVGGWLSPTVTVKLQVLVFPVASVTLKVFVVTPKGKVAPLANPEICVVVAPGQLSVPVGAV